MLLFKPATLLMKHLTYSRKMLVSGLFFCIPIVLLAYFLITNIREQVEFGSKERSGVQYVTPLGNTLQYLLDTRHAAAPGSNTSTDLERISAGLEQAETTNGSILATKESFKTVKAGLAVIHDPTTSSQRKTEAHTTLANELLAMIVLVADNSNLTLDPDIDSYYLMDTLITKLPPLAEALGRMETVASRIDSKSASPDDRTELVVLSGQIKSLLEATNKNIRSACAKNPALSQTLQSPLQDIGISTTAFLKTAAAGTNPANRNLSESAKNARITVFKAMNIVAPALDDLLTKRIKSFQSRMYIYLSISFFAFLLGVYLNIGCFLSVRDGIASICVVTGKVHSFADKLSASVGQQAAFSSQLSASVTEISATMEEFSATASMIADNSHEVVEIADQTLDGSTSATSELEALIDKMNTITSDNESSLQEIVELGHRSKEITRIMEIIGDIANQTKLIAFNAALEAASAGEAGKRFGVVAVEIRRLADSVVTSTGDTDIKITEIIEAVNRLVIASETGSKVIREGVEYSGRTMQVLSKVVDGSVATSEAARQISLSTQQQQISSCQVVMALRDIQTGASQASTSIQEINNIGKELTCMSNELKGIMERFSLYVASDN